MALFKSQLVTQVSGSVGGTTFAHAKGGMYMRARSIPVNPNTTFQAQVRAGLTNAVNRWTEVLTAAQRNAWETYASSTPVTNKLGDSITLSGQNMYIRSQTVQQQAANKINGVVPEITNAPVTFNLGDFQTPAVANINTVAGITLTLIPGDAWLDEDSSIMLLFQGKPFNQNRNYFRGPWRLIGFVAGDTTTPPSSLIVNTANITLRGYTLVTGQRTNLTVSVLREDGRLSSRRNMGNILIT